MQVTFIRYDYKVYSQCKIPKERNHTTSISRRTMNFTGSCRRQNGKWRTDIIMQWLVRETRPGGG